MVSPRPHRLFLALSLLVPAACVSNPPEDRLIIDRLAESEPGQLPARGDFDVPIPDALRSPHPLGVARVTYGIGRLEQTSGGPPSLNDDETSQMARLEFERIEGSVGGGFQATAIFGGDLHESTPVGEADTFIGEAFPHVTLRLASEHYFRMPIRLGPMFHLVNQDFATAAGGNIDRYSAGGRVEIAPELDILTRTGFRMSLFAEGHYGYGWALEDARSTAVDDEFDTTWDSYGGSAGLRFRWRDAEAQLGYTMRRMDFDVSDAEQGIVLPASDYRFDGATFSLGFHW